MILYLFNYHQPKASRKPNPVEDDHLSGIHFTANLKQPTRESSEAGSFSSPIWSCSERGLPCLRCYQRNGGLLPHLFTLTRQLADGIFSVALSVGSHPPHVMRRPALWSSDFPHPPAGGRDHLSYFRLMSFIILIR